MRESEELRANEGGGFAGFDGDVMKAAFHPLVGRIALVAGGFEGSVISQAFAEAFEVGVKLQQVRQRCRGVPEFAFESGIGRDLLFPLFEVLLPGAIGGVKLVEVPLIGQGNI